MTTEQFVLGTGENLLHDSSGNDERWRDLFRPDIVREYRRHIHLLSNVISDFEHVTPLLYMRHTPSQNVSSRSSLRGVSAVTVQKYAEIRARLEALRACPVDQQEIEVGAVETAIQVIDQLNKQQLAPPQLSWTGGEAIVFLWSLGNSKFALTVTEGEVGYVARRSNQTVARKHGLAPSDFDIRLIEAR